MGQTAREWGVVSLKLLKAPWEAHLGPAPPLGAAERLHSRTTRVPSASGGPFLSAPCCMPPAQLTSLSGAPVPLHCHIGQDEHCQGLGTPWKLQGSPTETVKRVTGGALGWFPETQSHLPEAVLHSHSSRHPQIPQAPRRAWGRRPHRAPDSHHVAAGVHCHHLGLVARAVDAEALLLILQQDDLENTRAAR